MQCYNKYPQVGAQMQIVLQDCDEFAKYWRGVGVYSKVKHHLHYQYVQAQVEVDLNEWRALLLILKTIL